MPGSASQRNRRRTRRTGGVPVGQRAKVKPWKCTVCHRKCETIRERDECLNRHREEEQAKRDALKIKKKQNKGKDAVEEEMNFSCERCKKRFLTVELAEACHRKKPNARSLR